MGGVGEMSRKNILCGALTAHGKPCKSLSHPMEDAPINGPTTDNRCDYCHLHCPHWGEFDKARKTVQALSLIMSKVNSPYSHANYSAFMKEADKLASQLLKIKGEEEE